MFESFDAFWNMGGFAGFVWPSYAICFGSLGLLAGLSIAANRRRRAELEQLESHRARRSSRTEPELTQT